MPQLSRIPPLGLFFGAPIIRLARAMRSRLYCTRAVASFAALFMVTFLFPFNTYAGAAPEFDLPSADGQVSLSSLRGKVVYVDFWATWCVPCRKSFPWMNEMLERYQDKGLEIVAINLDEDRGNVPRFLEKYPAKFTVLFDPEGESAGKYQVKGMPSSYLIDRKGQLISSHVGFRNEDKEELESQIRAALRR
jgi:thiol-disulfide isomerase/thioredoxin